MKDLGEYLKEQRQLNGVSLEEAAKDLKLEENELDNIEAGNTRAFNDVLALKETIKLYAKYLGLDAEAIIDEYNDFIFEHTSKLSLEDILTAQKKDKEERKKIVSPYTAPIRRHINLANLNIKLAIKPLITTVLVVLGILLIILIYMIRIDRNREIVNTELKGAKIRYEFTK